MDRSTDSCTFWVKCNGGSRCFQQWSVENSHTRRPGSGRQRSSDERQDRCIVQAEVAAQTASREEIRAHDASSVSPMPGCIILGQNAWLDIRV